MTIPQTFALALEHHQAGRLADAEALYRQILAAQPNHVEALHHLGIIALQANRQDLAVEWIRGALVLNPNNPGAYCNLGRALSERGQLDEAVAAYRRALQLQPNLWEAYVNLGNALRNGGHFHEAVAAYRRALELKPDCATARYNLGCALAGLGQLDEAIEAYRGALEPKPDYAEAWNNLGSALATRDQFEEAVSAYQRALQLKPGFADAHYNLGNALRKHDRLDEAAACYERALAAIPGFASAHFNRGVTWWLQGHLPEAEICYRRAIEWCADFAEAHLGLGILLLLLGRYEEGWREYEWRWRSTAHTYPLRYFSALLWLGQAVPGKTILIHAEQGFGDTLLFTRYLPRLLAHSRAKKVILECQPALVPLLEQLRSPEIDIVARGTTDESLPNFDLHLPLFSLPRALQCFAPIPPITPELQPDRNLRARWRERLGSRSGLRVGLAWAGNPAQDDDHRRSIAPEKLAPILRVPGVQFVSLQVETRGPLLPALADAGVLDFTTDIKDFADSAALMAELDLILTVDTATAHLAGMLGCPVWVLVPFVPYWPYGLGREETPWYPTMRLFRQAAPGNWEETLERAASALRNLCDPAVVS